MLKTESATRNSKWPRTCDICRAAACAVYCRADAAYLCTGCDTDIHSANPLARRHQRVPIEPVHGTDELLNRDGSEEEDENEAASWLLMNPGKNSQGIEDDNDGVLFGGDVDGYLDLEDYNSCQNTQFSSDHHHHQFNSSSNHHQQQHYSQKGKDLVQQQFFQLGLDDYEPPNGGYSNYPAPSLSHSVSFSSMEVGVVPDSTMSEVSISHPKGTIDLFAGSPIQMPTPLSPVDREARVSRYREKKKMRKFEKTIRYASRKAYAETRPRIKGRFAKRTDSEGEVDQMFSMSESSYGVVPSF